MGDQHRQMFRHAPLLATLISGLLLTVLLSGWMYRNEQEILDLAFAQRASARVAVIRSGFNDAVEALENINRLFASAESVSEEHFHQFAGLLLARHSYVFGFAFQRIVPLAQRQAYEAARQSRRPGFRITESAGGKLVPAGIRNSYRVVDYMEPLQGNESVIGVDIDSYTLQQEGARHQATDTGLAVASGVYRLMQERGGQKGISVLMPVYRHGMLLDTVDARRQAVTGYTSAVFRMGDLVENLLQASDMLNVPGFRMRVYAGITPDEHTLVFQKDRAAGNDGLLRQWLPRARPMTFSQTFEIAGAPWHMVVSSEPRSIEQAHPAAAIALFSGILLTLAMTAYLHLLARRTRRIEWLVRERTEDLQRANQLLTDDIATREKAEAALRKSKQKLRELRANQEALIESERKRIAREIHDDLGQNLLALRLDVTMLHQRSAAHSILHRRIGDALRQLDSAMKSVRTIINELRPLVLDLGLQATIEWQLKQFERRSGIACECDHDDIDCVIEDRIATALYRILQESLSNVRRHAHASRVRVGFYKRNGRLTLTVADDGAGFEFTGERKRDSFGLAGIEERISALGGLLAIDSRPGHGTTLTISVPVMEEAECNSGAVLRA